MHNEMTHSLTVVMEAFVNLIRGRFVEQLFVAPSLLHDVGQGEVAALLRVPPFRYGRSAIVLQGGGPSDGHPAGLVGGQCGSVRRIPRIFSLHACQATLKTSQRLADYTVY